VPHLKELAHLESTQQGGHYICSICHEPIDKAKEERAVNNEQKTHRTKTGRLGTYHTKAHAECKKLGVPRPRPVSAVLRERAKTLGGDRTETNEETAETPVEAVEAEQTAEEPVIKKKEGKKQKKSKKTKKAKKTKTVDRRAETYDKAFVQSYKSILVVIPSDIRDEMHLLEAKAQGIKVRITRDLAAGVITLTLLGKPEIPNK